MTSLGNKQVETGSGGPASRKQGSKPVQPVMPGIVSPADEMQDAIDQLIGRPNLSE